MSFWVIAGSGHCGTMWLSRVLDSIPGQDWRHERKNHSTRLSWHIADGYPPDSEIFAKYWRVIDELLDKGGVVGDSNSWPPEMLPTVHKVRPIDLVIYLTRDKDKQLNSLVSASPIWGNPPYSGIPQQRLEFYGRMLDRDPDVSLMVDINDVMPDWLREQGLDVVVYSLEELTTDYDRFHELTGLSKTQFKKWSGNNINQKVFE